MKTVVSGIYAIRCKVSGKVYIGSSKDIHFRWKQHLYLLKKGEHHSIKLQNAWNKYGEEAFEFQVVEEVLDGFLTIYEQTYINKFDSCKVGYNTAKIAGIAGGTKGLGKDENSTPKIKRHLNRERPPKSSDSRNSNTTYLRREPPKWKHLPSIPCRYPEVFRPYLDEIARTSDNNSKEFLATLGAIAAWAGEQENPTEALQQLLEIAQSK